MITQIGIASGEILTLIDDRKRPVSINEIELHLENEKELAYMSIKVLFVGVDGQLFEGYRRQCHVDGTMRLESVPDSSVALERVAHNGPYAVIVTDGQMEGMEWLEFIELVSERAPHSVRMMLIEADDQGVAEEALHAGHLFRFMSKPCAPETMVQALHAGAAQYRLITAEKELLEKTLTGAISILVEVLSHSEPALFARGKRLQEYVHAVAGLLEYPNRWELEVAALLSQIGGLTIPAEILLKERARHPLSEQEQLLLARIPESGSNLLARIPRLEMVAQIVRYQHTPFEKSKEETSTEATLEEVPEQEAHKREAHKREDHKQEAFKQKALKGEATEEEHTQTKMPDGRPIPRGARILKVLFDLIDLEATHTCRSVALRLMRSRQGETVMYDPQILEPLIAHYAEVLPTDGEAKHPHPLPRPVVHAPTAAHKPTPRPAYHSMAIPFADLTVGDLLTADIQTTHGLVLLPSGSLVTDLVLERLRNHVQYQGVREPLHVAVEDAKS